VLWDCPDPPQPDWQLELLDCDWLAFWFVDAVFDAEEFAVLLLFCEAELAPLLPGFPMVWLPTDTPPPSTTTGTLALTAF
jgi:hypothetical protein